MGKLHKWTGVVTCIGAFLTVVISSVYRMILSGSLAEGKDVAFCCLCVSKVITLVFGAVFFVSHVKHKERTRHDLPKKQKRQMRVYFTFATLSIVFMSLLNPFARTIGKVNAEQMYYCLITDNGGMDITAVTSVLFPALTLTVIRMGFFVLSYRTAVLLMEYYGKSKKYPSVTALTGGVLAFCITMVFVFHYIPVVELISYNYKESNYISDNYTNPKDTEIKFPAEKRNLIYIYLESMESSYASAEKGGLLNGKGLIPEIEKLAEENINLSHSTKLGGAVEGSGMSWTSGGMVANLYGLPLKCVNNKTIKGNSKIFSKTVGLIDLLEDNGYSSAIVMGSGASFGGIEYIWKGADIYDYDYFVEKGIHKDKKIGWGMYDYKVYEYGKEIINDISKKDKPFYVALNTIDTHYPTGYLCKYCAKGFDNSYETAINCAGRQVYSFVEWCKEQDWFENTTIIVVGDHLTMKNDFYPLGVSKSDRRILNLIINPDPSLSVKKDRLVNREFYSADMFPTALAAIGCSIEGNRLGLGTNLFSDEKTDYEKHGVDFVNKELSARSIFYEDLIEGS